MERIVIGDMTIACSKDPIKYSGAEISSHWAFNTFEILGDSIICFHGPLEVPQEEMVDLVDIMREKHLGRILISAKNALNFIVEHFDCQPPNLKVMYLRLRLLSFIAKEQIENMSSTSISRKGSDLFVGEGKLSVGIATVSLTSGKIHFGLNINCEGSPTHLKIADLGQLGFSREQISKLGQEIAINYGKEIQNLKMDIVKTRGLKSG